MSLQKVLEEIKKIRPLAEEDLDNYDLNNPNNAALVSTMGVRRGRKLQAVEQLKRLRMEYSDGLLKGAAFILTVGSLASEFESEAASKGSCFQTKAEGVFEDLANRVHVSLYAGRVADSNLFDVVGRHLEDKAGELGIHEYPQLLFKHEYARQLNGPEDLSALLKQSMVEQVGGELVGIDAVRSLTDKAIKTNHRASVTPILLTTSDETLALRLSQELQRLTPQVFVVVAGESNVQGGIQVPEVTAASVKAALKQIKDNLKK